MDRLLILFQKCMSLGGNVAHFHALFWLHHKSDLEHFNLNVPALNQSKPHDWIPNIPNYHMILWIAKFVSKDVAWKRSSWSFKNQEKHLPMEWSRQQNPLDVSVFISFLLDDSNPNIKKYLKRICPKSQKKCQFVFFWKIGMLKRLAHSLDLPHLTFTTRIPFLVGNPDTSTFICIHLPRLHR